jgi:glycosyltransferase involved in cell wall biosynthesis
LTTIVVTPVRNEAWILDRFLRCVSLWADHIVVADQGSADGSREIAEGHAKVTLIDNPEGEYDEGARQRLLLDAARGFEGRRVIFALDADEIPAANWPQSEAFERLARAAPGTVARMRWANILPGFESCWLPPSDIVFGFVDHGAVHRGERIHSIRLPVGGTAPSVSPDDVKVLHYQYTNWERMESKQRWYQCWELLNIPGKRPIQLYRQYHHMDAIPAELIEPLPESWIAPYEAAGIDMRSIPSAPHYPWDEEVAGWLREYGARRFRKLDIWDVDWEAIARRAGESVPDCSLADPRGPLTRAIHAWLRATQHRGTRGPIRLVQRALIPFGW